MKKKTKKQPTSDFQMEIAIGCRELLSGVQALTNPNYRTLNVHAARNDRLLHAVLCTYAKHHLGIEDIGWNKLSDILHAAICNEIGDDAYCQWSEIIKPEDANDA